MEWHALHVMVERLLRNIVIVLQDPREDKIRQWNLMYMCEEELQRYWRLADCTWIEESTADPPLYGIEKERISWSWKKTVQKAGGNSWVLDTPSLHIKFNQAIPTGNFVSFIS